jgi:hypothetical protein
MREIYHIINGYNVTHTTALRLLTNKNLLERATHNLKNFYESLFVNSYTFIIYSIRNPWQIVSDRGGCEIAFLSILILPTNKVNFLLLVSAV